MPHILLAATTDATQSAAFIVTIAEGGVGARAAHFTCPGIASAETGDLQKKSADGTWDDYYVDGTQQQITATNTGIAVYAPGIYRVDKSATAGATSVEVSTERNP